MAERETGPPNVTVEELLSERWCAGWKAISEYCGISEKTARRYAGAGPEPYVPGVEGYLPVYRRAFVDGTCVFAEKASLNEWKARRDLLRWVRE